MKTYHDMFRPAYEIPAAVAWCAGGAVLIISWVFGPMPLEWAAFGVLFFFLAGQRWLRAADLFRFRLSLSGYRVEEITVDELMERSRDVERQQALHRERIRVGSRASRNQ